MAPRWIVLVILCVAARIEAAPPPEIPETAPAPSPRSSLPLTPNPILQRGEGSSGPALPMAPPSPVVTLLVLVPQDVPPGQAIPYSIQVSNNSGADAGKVKVRMPLEGMTLVSAEPMSTGTMSELVWEFKSLPRGETKTIEVKLNAGKASEVTARAYVSYEFGQAVKTRLSNPKLKVTTELPREATTAQESIPVRVRVSNDGRVPLEKVKLTETISTGFEFHANTDGDAASPLVRTWDLGTIPAGMGKTIEYRVLAKTGRDLLVRSNVDGSGQQDTHEAKLKVQDVKLNVELRGDPTAVDDVASFKLLVKNDGSTTLTNVKVSGSVPADCRVTTRTNGGQVYRDAVQWLVPKLAPGESFLYKWEIRASAPGRKTVRAEAVSDRGAKGAMDVETVFAGAAALNWETRFEQATVGVDCTGMFTVKLTNSGSEPAKNARITITLPEQVSFVQATPAHKLDGKSLTFEAREVKAGGSDTYSITFRGERSGQAYFTAKLESDGSKPLTAEKYVQITNR